MYGYGQAVCLPRDICTFLLIRIFFTLLDEAFFIVTCDEVSFLLYSADVLKNGGVLKFSMPSFLCTKKVHQAGEIFHHRVIQIVSLAGYILYDAIILQHADNAILDLSAITGYGGSCVS